MRQASAVLYLKLRYPLHRKGPQLAFTFFEGK